MSTTFCCDTMAEAAHCIKMMEALSGGEESCRKEFERQGDAKCSRIQKHVNDPSGNCPWCGKPKLHNPVIGTTIVEQPENKEGPVFSVHLREEPG